MHDLSSRCQSVKVRTLRIAALVSRTLTGHALQAGISQRLLRSRHLSPHHPLDHSRIDSVQYFVEESGVRSLIFSEGSFKEGYLDGEVGPDVLLRLLLEGLELFPGQLGFCCWLEDVLYRDQELIVSHGCKLRGGWIQWFGHIHCDSRERCYQSCFGKVLGTLFEVVEHRPAKPFLIELPKRASFPIILWHPCHRLSSSLHSFLLQRRGKEVDP